MNQRIPFILSAIAISGGMALHAASVAPLHSTCSIGPGEEPGKYALHIDIGDCGGDRHCGNNFSNEVMNRFTGISLADLAREGAQLTATLSCRSGHLHMHRRRAQSISSPAIRVYSRSFVR